MYINQNNVQNKYKEADILRELKKVSTIQLVRNIVETSDSIALKVLLETRKLFRRNNTPPLLLPEYLLLLRNGIAHPDKFDKDIGELADCAYDLTLAKYSNLPNQAEKTQKLCRYYLRFTAVDCRNYYRAFLNCLQHPLDNADIKTNYQEEFHAGRLLQNLVFKNFLRSKMECRRYQPFKIRYTWNVSGIKLHLWYPSSLKASEFRTWLEKHSDPIDPNNPNEQERIQSLIYENFDRNFEVSLDDPDQSIQLPEGNSTSAIEHQEGHQFTNDLAKAVANRKSENIHRLRPGIRKLGKKVVKQIISQIFEALAEGEYNLSDFARRYGLSKATLSRFAGSRWSEKLEDAEKTEIPDLWRNTVKILSENQAFMETVLTTGFASEIKTVLDMIGPESDE